MSAPQNAVPTLFLACFARHPSSLASHSESFALTGNPSRPKSSGSMFFKYSVVRSKPLPPKKKAFSDSPILARLSNPNGKMALEMKKLKEQKKQREGNGGEEATGSSEKDTEKAANTVGKKKKTLQKRTLRKRKVGGSKVGKGESMVREGQIVDEEELTGEDGQELKQLQCARRIISKPQSK